MDVLAIIPARGGSKGIPRKNLRELAGKPLVAWSIEAALGSGRIARTVVSTDDGEIASVARAAGAEVVDRPAELARDDSPTEPCMLHALDALKTEGWEPELVVLLQPTSPLRRPGLIDECIDRLLSANADSLLTVCENHPFIWRRRGGRVRADYDYARRPRRQDIKDEERLYRENGSVYVTRREILLGERNRLGGRIEMFPMDPEESAEIDGEFDFFLIERIIERGEGRWGRR